MPTPHRPSPLYICCAATVIAIIGTRSGCNQFPIADNDRHPIQHGYGHVARGLSRDCRSAAVCVS